MVFKFLTLDLTEDINTTFPYTLPSSPESTICLPLGHGCSQPITSRVAAGVSRLFTAPSVEPAASAGIDLQFPDQKQLISFTYRELEAATNKFSKKNEVGQGGFGTVYKGCLPSGYLVAVKRLKKESHQGMNEFRAEVQVGKMVMHRNVLPPIGFCESKKPIERLLVYPFMGNGSLRSHLYERPQSQPVMDWETRKRIALGVARGISYLHDNCPFKIIHRDIKPSNILLDENLEPRVGDFGLARFMGHKMQVGHSIQAPDPMDGINAENLMEFRSEDHLDDYTASRTDRIVGTFGYMAPEYIFDNKFSRKTDVFAYGTLLLELISGCQAWNLHSPSERNGIYIESNWVKQSVETGNLERIVDSNMRGNYNKTEVERLIKLSLICRWSHSPVKRPTMSEVVSILEGNSSSSLDSRWEELRQNLVEAMVFGSASDQESCTSYGSGTCFITSSASHIQPEELSGPR